MLLCIQQAEIAPLCVDTKPASLLIRTRGPDSATLFLPGQPFSDSLHAVAVFP